MDKNERRKKDLELRDAIRKAGVGSSESVSLINKALETSDFLNGGRLNRAQQTAYEEFIRGTGDMMDNVDLRFTDRLRGQVDYMYFGSHVLEAGAEATTYGSTKEPGFNKREYSL